MIYDCEEKLEEILENIEKLKPTGAVSEIRMLRTERGTISGYYNDPVRLVRDIEGYIGRNDIYITLNPVKTDLLARSENRIQPYAKQTTSDADIEKISYVLIDLDPVRPAGISSTDQEKAEAFSLLNTIRENLLEEGFPESVLADSGNGYHMLLSVDLENTPENTAVIKEFLAALDFLHSNERVHVDKTTYNPARIVKLYGTTACKGDSTEERPHRDSKLIEVPESLEVIELELLQKIIAKKPRVEESKSNKSVDIGSRIDVSALIEKHELDLAFSAPYGDGTKYILKTCPWNPEHTDSAAYIVQFKSGAVAAGCHHNGCSDENWKTLKEKLGETALGSEAASDKKENPADLLLNLVKDFECYTDDLEEPYIDVEIKGKVQALKINSKKFEMYLRNIYFNSKSSSLGSDTVGKAVNTLASKAIFSGEQRNLQRRAALYMGKYYYDMGSVELGAVEIDENGCRMIENAPPIFIRNKNMRAQMMPDFNVKPEELNRLVKKHFRFKKDSDIILASVYLVTAFIAEIAHVVLILHGEKGAAKSTTMRMIKSIVDPAAQDLLTMPSSKQDLVITLSNNYMSCFDNLDSLSSEKSDLLCMASTGGAISARTLYSNDEETILQFKRLVVLNGINIVATRSDLLDRAVLLELERISKTERRTEEEIWKSFNADVPKFQGAIFNTIVEAISLRDKLNLDEVGRMADFSYWGYAVAESMGIGGKAFLDAYIANQDSANEEAIASHPIATAVIALMKTTNEWASSVAELLKELEQVADTEKINMKVRAWPKDPSALSKRLKEVKSNLEEVGITYDIRPAGNFKKITIEKKGASKVNSIAKKNSCPEDFFEIDRLTI